MRRRGASSVALAVVVAVAALGLTACPKTGATEAQIVRTTTTTTVAPATTTTSTTTTTTTTVPPPRPGAVEIALDGDLAADPPTLGAEHAGDLLRYQPVIEAPRLDGSVTPGRLWRVMYVSTNDLGGPIPVTGTVRVPTDRDRPADGWPVITYAHGTSGAADRCAPSRQLEFPPVPDPMVADGYVIAATDYAGLGTPGLHPYFDGASEGRAVLDAVLAADGLPGVDIADRFAIWGHSQGGHAALFARQLATERLPRMRLIGTVAFAPPSLMKDAMTAILVALQPKGFAAMMVAGIAATHPDARLDTILTTPAIGAILSVIETGCAADVDRALQLFGTTDIVLAPPNTIEPWATYLQASEPAMAPGVGPLLLVHAVDDRTVPPVMSATVKDRTCARGETTTRWLADHGGHNGVVGDTLPQARQWTLDRFAGLPAPSNCGQPDGPPPA